jgi:ABC-2 type transport system ATP-binding protein
VFVTTHYMEEAEYCHRVALMYRGRVVESGTPDELKRAEGDGKTMEDVFISSIEREEAQAK